MKKILLLASFISISTLSLFAQGKVDRSKKPAAGPAPVITIKDPAMYTLSNGMTVLVVEDHRLPQVSASLIIDAGPIKEGEKAGVMDLMGQMMEEGTTTKTKAAYDEAVDQIGASVNVYSGGGSASALKRYFPQAFALMADALRNPSFPAESLEKLKGQTLTGLKNTEKSAQAVSARTLNALSYGKQTAFGEFVTESSVKGISIADIKDAYKNYVTPSRSYLTFVGDITAADAKKLAEQYFGNWTGTKLTLPTIADVPNPASSEIDFVDMPTAVQAQINVGNLVTNPMNNKDYFALLLANQILGGGADSKLFTNLREKHGFTYGSYSSLGSGRFQSMFNATAQVRTDKADSAVAEIVNEINAMRNGDITEEQLATAKAKYNGSFALGMEDPSRSARYASNILINNLPKDFYRTYLQKINAVTLEDIKRVSKDYMNNTNNRIVIVGNADKIMPQLLRLGYTMKKYDIYAEPVIDAPKEVNANASAATTDKVSAYDIVETYLKAIGGKDELKKINTITRSLSMVAMGTPLTGTSKSMLPYYASEEMNMGPRTVFKRVFDGTNGYNMQMGQKAEMEMAEINEQKDERVIFPQLYYTTSGSGYKLDYLGAGKVGSEPTYRLKVVMPSGKTSVQQYSTKTGLLLEESFASTIGGNPVDITLNYSDYKQVGKVKLPYTVTQNAAGQEFTFTTTDVKLNEPMKAEDFK